MTTGRSALAQIACAAAVATVLVVVPASGAPSSLPPGGTVPEHCRATERVINHGKPLPWATALFGVLKSETKYVGTVLPAVLRSACIKRPDGSEYYDGKPDLHRAWKVRDPANPHDRWFRLSPGRDGMLISIGAFILNVSRCVLEAQHALMSYSTIGPPIDRLVTFRGVVADDVTEIRATGGTGTRRGSDGKVLPVEVTFKPKHNVYRFQTPNGAAKLTYVRRGAPAFVVNLMGPNPPVNCAG